MIDYVCAATAELTKQVILIGHFYFKGVFFIRPIMSRQTADKRTSVSSRDPAPLLSAAQLYPDFLRDYCRQREYIFYGICGAAQYQLRGFYGYAVFREQEFA